MSISILGRGWVTSQGCDELTVIEAIHLKKPMRLSDVENPFTGKVHQAALAAKEDYAEAEDFRRVRRSSTITLLALTAARRAIRQSGIEWNASIAQRAVLLFVSSDGGVVYTRRFYSDVVKSGAAGASPILFPETVYNAPASHLCAYFSIEGDAVTLVGDAAIGSSALHHASEILATGGADYCLVVAAEEMDWVLCEAYSSWRLTKNSRSQGTVFAEGAGALLLGRQGPLSCKTHPGFIFHDSLGMKSGLHELYREMTNEIHPQIILSSAAGTRLEKIEADCLTKLFPGIPVYSLQETLGEALAAGSLQQVVFAAALCAGNSNFVPSPRAVLISTIGLNGQAGAVLLTAAIKEG